MVLAILDPGISQSHPEAIRYLAESERIHRALNNPAGLAFAILQQANLALINGEAAQSESRFDEAERLAIDLGDDHVLSRMGLARMPLDLRTGDFAAARRHLEDSLQHVVSRGDHHLASGLAMLAIILQKQGLANWSARVFGMAEAWARNPAEMGAIEHFFRLWNSRGEVRAQLGDEAFAREIAAGHELKLEDLRAIPHPQGTTPAQPAPPSAPGAALTGREIEVLRLLGQDLSNSQIAERLVVSRRTVDAHLRSIYDKLDVKSRDAAVRAAGEKGLLADKISPIEYRQPE